MVHFRSLLLLMQIFSLVAMPPRMWRSDLFTSRIFLASAARPGFTCTRRDVRSLCTVLLLTPNFSPSAVRSLSSQSCKLLSPQHALRYSPSQKPPKTLFYSVFGGYDRYVFYFIYNTPIPLSSVPAPDRYPRFFGIFLLFGSLIFSLPFCNPVRTIK